jgi:hypothetical protein
MAVEPEITELLRQINVAREDLQGICEIANPPKADYKLALAVAQDIANEAMREAGWLAQ